MTSSKLPSDLVCAIGAAIVNYQLLEITIARLAWIVAFDDQHLGETKTAGVPFTELLKTLTCAFHKQVQHPSVLEQFNLLISRAESVHQTRNRVVHSWWFTDFHSGQPSRMKLSRNSVEQDLGDIDLSALSVETIKLVHDFEQFVEELYDANIIPKKPGLRLTSSL